MTTAHGTAVKSVIKKVQVFVTTVKTNCNLALDHRLSLVVKHTLSVRDVWDSITGSVKLDIVSPTAPCRYDVSSELCSPGFNPPRWVSPLVLRFGAIIAGVIIFFDFFKLPILSDDACPGVRSFCSSFRSIIFMVRICLWANFWFVCSGAQS